MEYPHTKRYVLVFQLHGNRELHINPPKKNWEEISEFDSQKEAETQAKEYLEYYSEDERMGFGMVLLDYKSKTILKWYGDKTIWTDQWWCIKACDWSVQDKLGFPKPYHALQNKDEFFRTPGEIPEDYVWDGEEEYKGWLQYRWGDGKNAVNPKPTIQKQKDPELTEEEEQEIWEKYKKEKEGY